MPAKIRKKSETGGLNQPDQVMTTLQTTYSTLDRYKYHIVGGFFGVVVLLLAISWFFSHREGVRKELAQTFFKALQHADAPVGEEPATDGVTPFPTSEAKYKKLAEELQGFIDGHDSAEIADTARLALASAKMELGEYEVAHQLLKGFTDKTADSALLPLVYENLAYASIRLGRPDEALTHFEKMKTLAQTPYLAARAAMHLGDFFNPSASQGAAQKDAAKARGYYDEALKALPEEEGDLVKPDPAIVLTRQELRLRLSLLDLV